MSVSSILLPSIQNQPEINIYVYNNDRYISRKTVQHLVISKQGYAQMPWCVLPGKTDQYMYIERFIHWYETNQRLYEWKTPLTDKKRFYEHLRGPLTIERIERMSGYGNKRYVIDILKLNPDIRREAIMELLNV